MGDLVIRNEHLPERCDICHKSDFFNKQTGICDRCTQALEQNDSRSKKNFLFIKPPSPSIYTELQKKENSRKDLFYILEKGFSYLFKKEKIEPDSPQDLNSLLHREFRHSINAYKIFIGIPIFLSLILGFFNRVYWFGTLFLLIIGVVELLALKYKCIKFDRIVSGTAPVNMLVVIKKETDSDDFPKYIAELFDNVKSVEPYQRLTLIRPSWAVDAIINKPLPAQVYFHPKKKKRAVIHSQLGILLSI